MRSFGVQREPGVKVLRVAISQALESVGRGMEEEVGKAVSPDPRGPQKSHAGFGLGPKGKPLRGLKQWKKMMDLHEK